MDDSINYAEYTVEQKPEGSLRQKRILLITLYAVFLIGGMVLFVGVLNLWPVGAIIPFLTWILWGFTWKYVQLEHKYEIANAKFRISEIYGRKKQETVFENLVSGFSLIAPMNDEYKDQYESADTVADYRGSKASVDSYFALLEKDGKKTAVCFEATNKMLKVMKFYNSKATVVTEMRY